MIVSVRAQILSVQYHHELKTRTSRVQHYHELKPERLSLWFLQKPEEAAERADKELTVKRRTMGNIKLIGELYKQKMIPEKIVHACLQQLLGDPKEEPVEENTEALVHLLTTVSGFLSVRLSGFLLCCCRGATASCR